MKTFQSVSATVTMIAVLATSTISAYACHPVGMISKQVMNQTTGSTLSEADTTATAVAAKPGDVLQYSITIRNDGVTAANNDNDMTKVVLSDTLPAGLEQVANPAQRTITENIGTIKPKASVTKTYQVKVAATTSGTIDNKACYNGYTIRDDKLQGCNDAIVKVTIPATPVTPITTTPVNDSTPTPATVAPAATLEAPTTLPNTGAGSSLMVAALATVVGSLGYHLTMRRRSSSI